MGWCHFLFTPVVPLSSGHHCCWWDSSYFLIIFLQFVMSFFLWMFSRFSFCHLFWPVCLWFASVVLIVFILIGVVWISWMCHFKFFMKLRKKSAIIILISFPSPLLWNFMQVPALWKLPLDQWVHLVWYWVQATLSTLDVFSVMGFLTYPLKLWICTGVLHTLREAPIIVVFTSLDYYED